MQEETIDLYEAIAEMKRLTSKGQSFSFIHSTFHKDKRSTDGIRAVSHARLRPKTKNDEISNSDYKLFYFDEDIQKPRNCWQVLIMYFNGKKVILN